MSLSPLSTTETPTRKNITPKSVDLEEAQEIALQQLEAISTGDSVEMPPGDHPGNGNGPATKPAPTSCRSSTCSAGVLVHHDDDEGEDYYQIQTFLGRRVLENGETQFLIKWMNYTGKPTWERDTNLYDLMTYDKSETSPRDCVFCAGGRHKGPHVCWLDLPPARKLDPICELSDRPIPSAANVDGPKASNTSQNSKKRTVRKSITRDDVWDSDEETSQDEASGGNNHGHKRLVAKQRTKCNPRQSSTKKQKLDAPYKRLANNQPRAKQLGRANVPKPPTLLKQLRQKGDIHIPDSDKGEFSIEGRIVEHVRVNSKERKRDTFLQHFLGRRLITLDEKLSDTSKRVSPYIVIDSKRYELISAKIQADMEANNSFRSCFIKPNHGPKIARLVYALVSGPGVCDISIQEELEKLADFASLNPRKIAARLELLQSPMESMFPNLSASDIAYVDDPVYGKGRMTDDEGVDGCGYISEDFLLYTLYGNRIIKPAAIQVRIFAPTLGIFKGMLVVKPAFSGPPIQVRTTMRKVGPSKHPSASSNAFLVVTKIGFHPNKTNRTVGTLLSATRKAPSTEESEPIKFKPVTEMILRLWHELGVPRDLYETYARDSCRGEHLKHAWVVGVADPTGKLQPGHIFLPGLGLERKNHKQLFVTRSPCVRPNDGRLLPLVTSKPNNLSQNLWDWLNGLPFGLIVFANPKPGMKPLPAHVAGGDLDGDLYFCCWHPKIISSLAKAKKSVTVKDVLLPITDDKATSNMVMANKKWFEQTQTVLSDLKFANVLHKLIGKLYNMSKLTADESSKYMSDPDAMAFANAYDEALSIGKHGGTVRLPVHLIDQIPANLRDFVVPL